MRAVTMRHQAGVCGVVAGVVAVYWWQPPAWDVVGGGGEKGDAQLPCRQHIRSSTTITLCVRCMGARWCHAVGGLGLQGRLWQTWRQQWWATVEAVSGW